MNLYKEALTDHYRSPRNRGFAREQNKGPHQGINFASESHNPSCGDSISWQGSIVADKVNSVAFEGKGCVISQGAASMLSEVVIGKATQEIIALDTPFMLSLIGLELGPTRVRCALLPLQALHQGIIAYQNDAAHHNP